MPDSPQIVVVGSHAPGIFLRVKRVPLAGETVIGWDFQEPKDGGKGSNQAIAAALLGGNVSFVGCLGKDRIGDEGEDWLKEAGVDTTWLHRHASAASGVGFILLDERGVPAMVTSMGANTEITREQINTALHGMTENGVLLTQFEIPTALALYAARAARSQGKTAIVNPAPAPEEPLAGLDAASILLPNEAEACTLLGMNPAEGYEPLDLVEKLRQQAGAGCVIVTLGEKGAVGCDAEGCWQVRAPVVEVVDTSGAGDVFCAALAVALINGKSIREASGWACVAASLSVSRPGTIPAFPTRSEVETFFNTAYGVHHEVT